MKSFFVSSLLRFLRVEEIGEFFFEEGGLPAPVDQGVQFRKVEIDHGPEERVYGALPYFVVEFGHGIASLSRAIIALQGRKRKICCRKIR